MQVFFACLHIVFYLQTAVLRKISVTIGRGIAERAGAPNRQVGLIS